MNVAYYVIEGSTTVAFSHDAHGAIQAQVEGNLRFRGSFYFSKHPTIRRRWIRGIQSGINVLESSLGHITPVILTRVDNEWGLRWIDFNFDDDGLMQDTFVSPPHASGVGTLGRPESNELSMYEQHLIIRRDRQFYSAYVEYDCLFDGETFDAIISSAEEADAL